jgi:lactoylglutathione lyase
MRVTVTKTALSLMTLAIVVVSIVRYCAAEEGKEQTSMKLGYTILYVNDVEATLRFYERAFGLKRKMLDEGKQYGELDTGGTTLAFAANGFVRSHMPVKFEEAGPSKEAPPIELGMVTQDVENSFRQAVAAGAVEVKKPEKKPWGQTVGYVRDINGFLVEICSPIP